MSGLYSPWFFQQIRDDLGNPLSNGSLSTFETNSIIPKPVYTDFELLYPHPNPVPLDAAGYVPQYFLTSGAYTFVFKDRFGNVVRTSDKVYGVAGDSGSVSAYVLPIASSLVLGGIRIGSGLSIDGSGVVSTVSAAQQVISLSAYATLSGSNFSGPVSAPSLSSTSVSALTFETSSVKISQTDNLLKIIENNGYYQDSGISFGLGDDNKIYTKDGQMYLGGLNSYCSFDGSNFYITSGNLIVGDPGVATNLGQKSLQLNQQLVVNQRSNFNSSAIYFDVDSLKNKTLITNSNGQLSGTSIGSVRYESTDKEGYLKDKIVAGSGITILTADNGSGSKVMSINSKSNNWTITKQITASPYIVLDTDATLNNNTTDGQIILPNPTALYLGRIVVLQGCNLGGQGTFSCLGTMVGISPVVQNYEKKEAFCGFDGVNYIWIIRN